MLIRICGKTEQTAPVLWKMTPLLPSEWQALTLRRQGDRRRN